MVSALLTKNHPRGWIVPHFDNILICQTAAYRSVTELSHLLLVHVCYSCWSQWSLSLWDLMLCPGCLICDFSQFAQSYLVGFLSRMSQHCFLWCSSPSWLIEYRSDQLCTNSFISFVSDLVCSPRQWFGDVCLHWNCYWIGTCVLSN